MSENLKVVVHQADGTLVKGSTQDFNPDRPMFRVVLRNGVDTTPVQMAKLKAVFFVRHLDGEPHPPRQKDFSPDDAHRGNGRPVAVLFKDGELLIGYTNSYNNPERQGFFMLPADPADNNLRVFVLKKATKTVKHGPAAEEFTRAAKNGPPPPPSAAAA